MENQKLEYDIKKFLKDKNFENTFLQECITEFIVNHTKLYGDVVSSDQLIERLYKNLDKITFAGSEKTQNGEMGMYKGRIADNQDLNEIMLFFSESDLELSEMDKKLWKIYTDEDKQKVQQKLEEKKAQIKSTLMHELAHAAYTIKDEHGIGEKHIFSESVKDLITGKYRQFGSNNNDVEGIINYISNRVEGKNANEVVTYKGDTKAIFMLAEKMDEKQIIKAAWISDEEQLEKSYIDALGQGREKGQQSYRNFQKGMQKLVINRSENLSYIEENKKNNEILSEIQDLLDGKELELDKFKTKDTQIHKFSSIEIEEKVEMPFLQKLAKFLGKYQSLMKIPFIKNFVNKKLNVLPSAKNHIEISEIKVNNGKREQFLNGLSNNEKYKKLEPIQYNEEESNENKTNKQSENQK